MPARNKEQAAIHRRTWYLKHTEQRIAEVKARRARLQQWFQDYKATLSCVQCGENHPATLAFHHRDPSEKEVVLGRAVAEGWGIERIQREIAKCDVLCANCHRKLHASN